MSVTSPEAKSTLVKASSLRWKSIRESAAGLLFIFPALLIIFMFGLFPILFSVYVSMHKWRITRGDYFGLGNFERAFDNLAYVIAFWVAIVFLYLAWRTLRSFWKKAQEAGPKAWLFTIPALVITAGLAKFLQFFLLLLPEVLDIALKVRGQKTTQELFLSLLGEAWQLPTVQVAFRISLLIIGVGLLIFYLTTKIVKDQSGHLANLTNLISILMMLGIAAGLIWLTGTEILAQYSAALESGEQLEIWSQVVTISAGFILLLASWLTWRSGVSNASTMGMVLKLAAAAMLIVGAWFLIAELPRVVQAGDEDWWKGLMVTVYYSLGTVPIQLGLALFLAILLFQEIRAKSFFRLVYFLPYITPAVAAAGVFRVLFSSSPGAFINDILVSLGGKSLLWLDEPAGIFKILGGDLVPEWLAGPSLALVVIILFNIWSYVGYDIVIFLAGLGGIPRELYEAASIDGAGSWAQFRNITLPLLSPTTYFLTLLSVIGTFKAFNHVWVLRKGAALGTTDTASIVIFTEFQRNTRYGYAASLALILFIIILILTIINNRIAEERVFYG